MRAVYIILLFALALQGCGKKGPLVMPQPGGKQAAGAQSGQGQQSNQEQQK